MSDLAARLRKEAETAPNEVYTWLNPLLVEAAEEIERLRAALKPFADYVDQLDGKVTFKGSGPTMQDWLAAHAALEQSEGGDG